MSESRGGPLPEELRKEPAPLRLLMEVSGLGAKLLVPSILTANTEDMSKYPGYQLLLNLGQTSELMGVGLTLVGNAPLGVPVAIAGKFVSLMAEHRVRMAKGTSAADYEPIAIKTAEMITGLASKVLLPSFFSAGEVSGRGYKLMLETARILEAASIGGVLMSRPEIAVATYVGGRTLALGAEAGYKIVPKAGELAQKAREAVTPVATGLAIKFKEVAQIVLPEVKKRLSAAAAKTREFVSQNAPVVVEKAKQAVKKIRGVNLGGGNG